MRLPANRIALQLESTGEIRLAYPQSGMPLRVFIQLRNSSDRKLYATLLVLTDQHRAHDSLFPCTQIAPLGTAQALSGKPVEVTLPAGRASRTGRDWLKLIVAEERFSTLRFQMPVLGEPAARPDPPATRARRGGRERRRRRLGPDLLPIITTA